MTVAEALAHIERHISSIEYLEIKTDDGQLTVWVEGHYTADDLEALSVYLRDQTRARSKVILGAAPRSAGLTCE